MSLAGHSRYCKCDGCRELARWNKKLAADGLSVIDKKQIVKRKPNR